MPEIEQQLLSMCNFHQQNNNVSLDYHPSIDTFFNCIRIKNAAITITSEYSNEDDIAEGGFDKKSIVWTNDEKPKIESFDLYCNIKSSASRLSYNIQRTIGHELLHAYEAYKRNLLKKTFDTPKEKDFYQRITILMEKGNAPQKLFANLFYLNNPQELKAYSQGIQSGYNAIAWSFSVNFHEFPFAMLKKQIREFQVLEKIKEDIKWIYEKCSESDLLVAMNTIVDKPVTTINQLNKIVNYQLFNIEQTYNKALSRAVENRAINEMYMDYGPKDYMTQKSLREQLNKIYEEYRYPPNVKIEAKKNPII